VGADKPYRDGKPTASPWIGLTALRSAVPFVDALLFPLDNTGVASFTLTARSFSARCAARAIYDGGVRRSRPATLDGYFQ
jgi:hypothetical protein